MDYLLLIFCFTCVALVLQYTMKIVKIADDNGRKRK